jgi:hypothetical protein
MPIDYSKYPKNWKTEIRPTILARAENKCEFCKVPNRIMILRGERNGKEVYQNDNGDIFNADTSERIGADYVGEMDEKGRNRFVRIVLTIAHLDHDIQNNDPNNLRALCQRCHNRHDVHYRKESRKRNKGVLEILF